MPAAATSLSVTRIRLASASPPLRVFCSLLLLLLLLLPQQLLTAPASECPAQRAHAAPSLPPQLLAAPALALARLGAADDETNWRICSWGALMVMVQDRDSVTAVGRTRPRYSFGCVGWPPQSHSDCRASAGVMRCAGSGWSSCPKSWVTCGDRCSGHMTPTPCVSTAA